MKLSIWIFSEWLKAYSPEITVRDGGLNIETVRLFSSDSPADDTCLYIGRLRDLYVQGNDDVICTNKNDMLLLRTSDLDEVMNRILDAFEYFQRWNVRLLEAISSDRRPAEILDIANEVIHEPLYLLDSNQYAMALSSGYGYGSVNQFWDQMLDTGTAEISFLTRLNEEYPQHLTNRGLYRMHLPFLPSDSFNYNMFLRDKWIGLSSMIECGPRLPQSTIDLFHIFCQNIELWFLSHSQEQESLMIDSLFRETLLSGNVPDETFRRQYQLRFRTLNTQKYILLLRLPNDQSLLASHLCRELNLSFPYLMAILYQKYICILLNDRKNDPAAAFSDLKDFMVRNRCSGGCSSSFSDLMQLPERFREALYAADYRQEITPGDLCLFDEISLAYALEETGRHMTVNLVHPEVSRLIAYDEAHHTEFARTLEVWLTKERSQAKTAQALHLHRNTLTYRLQRIRELLTCDLEDDDTRLHLLLSFRFSRAAG